MSTAFAALLSLFSALLVAILGHAFSVKRKRTDELEEMKLRAYCDFINAASRLVAARRMGHTQSELDELAALNDAKTRICICAEAPIVEALVEFWKHGGTLEREQEILAFTNFCRLIRESFGHKRHDTMGQDISGTLFKIEPSSYSYRVGNRSSASTEQR